MNVPFEDAMTNAIKYCIEHEVLKQFLEENSPEVVNMLLEEWNLDDALAVSREEALEEGREEGREEVLKLIRQGYTTEQIEAKLTEIAIHR